MNEGVYEELVTKLVGQKLEELEHTPSFLWKDSAKMAVG